MTSGLVERLTRRELDSVLAHEVGHLRGKHVGVKVTMFWAYFLVVGPAASSLLHRAGLPGWLLALPIVPIAYVLAAAQISQRHEFSADARAVEITGDPEGMIASLSRLSRIGSSPVDWGGIQGSILSHPSMKKRVLAIADRFNLPRERALAVLEEPGLIAPNGIASSGGGDDAPAHYDLPAGMEAGEPVYNAAARAGHVFWSSWGTRVALVSMLGAMGVLAQRLAPSQPRAVALFFACIPLAAWLYLRMSNSWDRLFRKSLKRRMGQRLQPENDAIFVGLAPGDRVYPVGGSYDWDLGFLSLAPDWLSYQGEQARFSVARGAVTGISIEPGPLAWDRTYGVVVKHHGGAFILRRSDAGVSLRQARKLSSRLYAWWRPNANQEPATNTAIGGDSPFPPPSLPLWEPVFPSRWKVAFGTAMKAGMLFVGTLLVLATTVPMTQATMMFSLVPLAAPLAYLVAVGPILFRRRPA